MQVTINSGQLYAELDTLASFTDTGTVLMPRRHDAFLAAAEISLAVESAAKSTGAIDTVATVGVCDVFTRRFVEFHLRLCIEIDAQPTSSTTDLSNWK